MLRVGVMSIVAAPARKAGPGLATETGGVIRSTIEKGARL
jgi:hypothetical protein